MRALAGLAITTIAMTSCLGPSVDQRAKANAEADLALDAFVKRAIEVVPSIDDKVSDASTIALALTNACINEYNAYTEAKAAEAPSNYARQYFRALRNSKDQKIQSSLEIVLSHRTGRLKNKNK